MSAVMPTRRRTWWAHVGGIAERGRQVLNEIPGFRRQTLADLCRELIVRRGEASGLALAAEIVDRLRSAPQEQVDGFLRELATEFGVNLERVEAAVAAWHLDPRDPAAQRALAAAVEAPRQELFRRLNVAENGTAVLVLLRARILELMPGEPALAAVDDDLRHLFTSWFNRGFLRLETIGWSSPAVLLEKIIEYEAVHEIAGWDDLRRRLAADRRCFGFFHPAMPGEPLVFVEVALTQGLSGSIRPLLDPDRPTEDPRRATTAIFYSISNTQDGLRGISFGNFLIKQVVSELRDELPGITSFATLSPLPRLASALRAADPCGFTAQRLQALVGGDAAELRRRFGEDELVPALERLLGSSEPRGDALERLARRVVLAYLTQARRGDRVLDPVAHFHLSNGARLERINLDADPSERGLRQSHGVMVNYRYSPAHLELNHEAYVAKGEVSVSRSLAGEAARVRAAWTEAG